jgi:hypothetical protein
MLNASFKNYVGEHMALITLAIILLCSLLVSKVIFLIFLFVILDYAKNILELKFYMNYLPVKIMEIGMISVSYFYSFFLGFLLIGFYFANKFIFGRLDDRSVFDAPSLVIIAALSDLLSNYSFIVVGICLFVFRYVLDLIIEFFISHNLRINNIPARILNSFVAYFIFAFFSLIL